MPLYIKDDTVSLLAEQLATALSSSKTEAVKRVLTDKLGFWALRLSSNAH